PAAPAPAPRRRPLPGRPRGPPRRGRPPAAGAGTSTRRPRECLPCEWSPFSESEQLHVAGRHPDLVPRIAPRARPRACGGGAARLLDLLADLAIELLTLARQIADVGCDDGEALAAR